MKTIQFQYQPKAKMRLRLRAKLRLFLAHITNPTKAEIHDVIFFCLVVAAGLIVVAMFTIAYLGQLYNF